MRATGYAVVLNGEIHVGTVSPTQRGAKVNWLHSVAHVTMLNSYSDFMIERMWQMHHDTAECLRVEIIAGLSS
jgi:hypothetical protein